MDRGANRGRRVRGPIASVFSGYRAWPGKVRQPVEASRATGYSGREPAPPLRRSTMNQTAFKKSAVGFCLLLAMNLTACGQDKPPLRRLHHLRPCRRPAGRAASPAPIALGQPTGPNPTGSVDRGPVRRLVGDRRRQGRFLCRGQRQHRGHLRLHGRETCHLDTFEFLVPPPPMKT